MKIYRKALAAFLALILLASLAGCQAQAQPKKDEKLKRPNESFLKYGDTNDTIVELNKINNSVWVHTTYYDLNGSLTPSNGLVVLTDTGVVLIDTPWTDKQTESLDKLLKESFNAKIKEAIITHAHVDRIGGAGYLEKKKIPVASLEVVAKMAQKKGFTVPDQVSKGDSVVLNIDKTDFELYYPGEGHTADNTVVWIDKYKVLFGGCLIKEHGANNLGSIGEANLDMWPQSIQAVKDKYPQAEIVVPGHGQWGDASLIDYTLELFDE
ncbi:MAG: subclass B1 metallo-beta-lactamase [Clostridia bacterium]|nr:subclass B1 metallo-beta-lactamase [Clostridia bacterium]